MPRPSTYRWSFDLDVNRPLPEGDPRLVPVGVMERLQGLVDDRMSGARALSRRAAAALLQWLQATESETTTTSAEDLALALERGWSAFLDQHGWRGPVALFADAVRTAFAARPDRSALALELERWVDPEGGASGAVDVAWSGAPFEAGPRLRPVAAVAESLLAAVEVGEEILCPSPTWVVVESLQALARAGKRPLVRLGVGSGDGIGAAFARELAAASIPVHLFHDVALIDQLDRADRVWIGTEAIGSSALVARVGTRSVCRAAQDAGVPVECLCTGDDLMPAGESRLPAWPAEETWHLVDTAPEGVRLHSQMFTEVPLSLVDRLRTDAGNESPAQLSLRCLRTTPAPDLRMGGHADPLHVPTEAPRDTEA